MAKVTIELSDESGSILTNISMSGPFDFKSPAHNAGARVLEFLDGLLEKQSEHQDVEPRMIKTVEDINAIKAATLHNQAQPIIMLGG